jgi:hypothetical protein
MHETELRVRKMFTRMGDPVAETVLDETLHHLDVKAPVCLLNSFFIQVCNLTHSLHTVYRLHVRSVFHHHPSETSP